MGRLAFVVGNGTFRPVLCMDDLPDRHGDMFLHHPVHDGYVLALDVVDYYLADLGGCIAVPEEEQVASLEGRLHGTGQDDHDGGGTVGNYAERLPHHEGGAEDEGEVENLLEGLPGRGQSRFEVGEHGGRVGVGSRVWWFATATVLER